MRAGGRAAIGGVTDRRAACRARYDHAYRMLTKDASGWP